MRASGIEIDTSPLAELFYHVLACLPVSKADASSLQWAPYSEWVAQRVKGAGRTLPVDAPLLAQLYDRAPRASLLHALPTLYPSIEAFLKSVSIPFQERDWDEGTPTKLLEALSKPPMSALVELFEISCWSEHLAYQRARRETLHDPAAFAEQLETLLYGTIPHDGVRFTTALPLCRRGRLLKSRDGRPWVLIGQANDLFAVPSWAPLLQAAHELCVLQVAAPHDASRSTHPRHPSYHAHLALEVDALSLGARLFGHHPHYFEWLQECIKSPRHLLARLPWVTSVSLSWIEMRDALIAGELQRKRR